VTRAYIYTCIYECEYKWLQSKEITFEQFLIIPVIIMNTVEAAYYDHFGTRAF